MESMLAGLNMTHGVIAVAWDDVNYMSMLNPDTVIEARKTEMEYVRNMQVHDVVPRDMIWQTQAKIIDTRWIDTNKADESNQEYRSGLCWDFNIEKMIPVRQHAYLGVASCCAELGGDG